MDKNTTIQTIDAKNQKLGRLAGEVASILMGKHDPSFDRSRVAQVKVQIVNASQLSFDERKLKTKQYTRYTGYPSGLRTESLKQVIARHGHTEVIRRAIYGMLPGNKLRARMMKNIYIEN